ncbi:MAG: hypothetical protein ABIL49_03335 [candidate division WOR-3 bacterium]
MTFLVDSLLVFYITLDSLKVINFNKDIELFEFANYKVKDSLTLLTKEISGLKNYVIYFNNNKKQEGKIYFEKGKSANYFLIFFKSNDWYVFGISQSPSSVWINDSVIDLINGEYFFKKLSKAPYKLKIVKNKFIVLKEYKFE